MGVDSRVVVRVQEFLLRRSQRVRLGGPLYEEVRVTSGVPQGSALGPLRILRVLMIFGGTRESNVRLFADDCAVYRKITDGRGIGKSQMDLDRLWNWAVENEMKVSLGYSKAVRFSWARVKDPLNYCFGDKKILEASSFKYLGIMIRRDLIWAYQVNYTVQNAWKALHFIMRTLKKGNSNSKSLAYTSLVRQIVEYGL